MEKTALDGKTTGLIVLCEILGFIVDLLIIYGLALLGDALYESVTSAYLEIFVGLLCMGGAGVRYFCKRTAIMIREEAADDILIGFIDEGGKASSLFIDKNRPEDIARFLKIMIGLIALACFDWLIALLTLFTICLAYSGKIFIKKGILTSASAFGLDGLLYGIELIGIVFIIRVHFASGTIIMDAELFGLMLGGALLSLQNSVSYECVRIPETSSDRKDVLLYTGAVALSTLSVFLFGLGALSVILRSAGFTGPLSVKAGWFVGAGGMLIYGLCRYGQQAQSGCLSRRDQAFAQTAGLMAGTLGGAAIISFVNFYAALLFASSAAVMIIALPLLAGKREADLFRAKEKAIRVPGRLDGEDTEQFFISCFQADNALAHKEGRGQFLADIFAALMCEGCMILFDGGRTGAAGAMIPFIVMFLLRDEYRRITDLGIAFFAQEKEETEEENNMESAGEKNGGKEEKAPALSGEKAPVKFYHNGRLSRHARRAQRHLTGRRRDIVNNPRRKRRGA